MEITKQLVREKLPKRPKDANKGTFGSSLIIAGSRNYPGAAILSCLACAGSGAGLVTLATSPEVYKAAVPKIPFATFLDFSEIEENIEKYNSILIGPGLGLSEETKLLVKKLETNEVLRNKRIVLDADALNILSGNTGWYKNWNFDFIITPHPKEMARLCSVSVDKIQTNREKAALGFAKKWNKTIVLKGAETVIANPLGEIYKADFANPLLATAGTGDVLSGIIAGLLAQVLDLTDAAVAGVYIHGSGGEILKEKFGDRGATALDLVEVLLEVFKNLNPRIS